jgi:hypothetical protein
MPVEVTYGDYTANGGTLSEQAFMGSLQLATTEVDFLVGTNEVTDEDAYRRAVCAAVDAAEDALSGGSISIGSFSVSGRAAEGSEEAARDAASKVLASTGMIYMGLR